MKQPRIFIVVASFYPLVGGIQSHALVQSQSLRERGYEATIITFRHRRAWLRNETLGVVPVIRVAGALLDKRERLPRMLQRIWYLLAIAVMGWHLWRYRHRYDLLHVYQLNLLALPAAIVARLTGKPIVVAVHCADSGVDTRQHLVPAAQGAIDVAIHQFFTGGREKDVSDLEGLERAGKLFVYLLRRLLRRTSAEIVILSSRMWKELAVHGFASLNIQHIPNGVDISLFTPRRVISAYNGPQVVVCTARLCYQKGIDVLLLAWRLVSQQLPSPTLLLIVGGGPMQTQLEHMAEVLGIAESVEFAGEQRDVVAQLRRGTIGVLPSRWEGMPISLLETMACGLPCVATRVSGSEDVIQTEVNGLLVEPEDHQGLAQALLTLLSNPELAEQYGRAARETIESHYSHDSILISFTKLYHELTNQPIEATVTTSP